MRARLAALLLGLCLAAPALAEQTVHVGLRADAPPFSWLKTSGSGAQFTGFLVDLCRGAFQGTDFRIVEVGVTASDRFDKLRLGGAQGGVDMLCEPTSIQLRSITEFLVSSVVFATGVGYLRHDYADPKEATSVIGRLDGTTAEAAIHIALQKGALPALDPAKQRIVVVKSHLEGIEKVCSGEFQYYFGDLDILNGLQKNVRNCDRITTSQHTFFSFEAYALTVNAARSDVAIALQAGIYRQFSDGSATAYYKTHFDERPRSGPLTAVFALNAALPCNIEAVSPDPCQTLRSGAARSGQ